MQRSRGRRAAGVMSAVMTLAACRTDATIGAAHRPREGGPACAEVPGVAGVELLAVWSAASTDAWAVGKGGVLHWDGTRWSRAEVGAGGDAQGLRYVSGSGPDDVWIGEWHAPARVRHWDGHAWTLAAGGWDAEKSTILGLAATGPGNVWVFGYTADAVIVNDGPPLPANKVWHFDGARWSDESAALHPADTQFAAAANGVNDVWLGGSTVYHWNGTAWTRVAASLRNNQVTSAMWSAGPGDLWAVEGVEGGSLLRHGGDAWRYVHDAYPESAAPRSLLPPQRIPTYEGKIFRVTGTATDDVWLSGYEAIPEYDAALHTVVDRGDVVSVLHWDGARWDIREIPRRAYGWGHLGLAPVRRGEVWAVSGDRTYRCSVDAAGAVTGP